MNIIPGRGSLQFIFNFWGKWVILLPLFLPYLRSYSVFFSHYIYKGLSFGCWYFVSFLLFFLYFCPIFMSSSSNNHFLFFFWENCVQFWSRCLFLSQGTDRLCGTAHPAACCPLRGERQGACVSLHLHSCVQLVFGVDILMNKKLYLVF